MEILPENFNFFHSYYIKNKTLDEDSNSNGPISSKNHEKALNSEISSIAIPDTNTKLYMASGNSIYIISNSSKTIENYYKTSFSSISSLKFCNSTTLLISGISTAQSPILRYAINDSTITLEQSYQCTSKNAVSFCVNKNLNTIYAGCEDGNIIAWNYLNGKSSQISQEKEHSMITEIDLTPNDLLLAVASEANIFVYETSTSKICKKLSAQSRILSLKICEYKSLFCVAGCADSKIYVWNHSSTVPVITKQGHESYVLTLAVHNNVLVSGDLKGTVLTWDLLKDIEPIPYFGHSDAVRCIEIDSKSTFFYSAGSDKTLREWKFPDLSEYIEIPLDLPNIDEFRFSLLNPSVVFFHNNKDFYYYNTVSEASGKCNLNNTTYIISISNNTKNFYTVCKNNPTEDYKSIVSKFSCAEMPDCESVFEAAGVDVINSIGITPDDTKIICGTIKAIIIYSAESLFALKELSIYGGVTNLVTSNYFVIFVELPNKLNKWVFDEDKVCDYEIERVDMLKITYGHSKLITYRKETGWLKVWLSADFTEIVRLKVPTLADIIPHPQHNHFLVLTDNCLYGYSFETFTKVFSIKCPQKGKRIVINEEKMKMYMYYDKILRPYEIDLAPTSPNRYFIGTENLKSKFELYLKELIEDKIKERDPEMEDFLIMPDHKNLLHYYALTNRASFLTKALDEGAGFIKSAKGTPLDISIEKKNDQCFLACKKYLKKEIQYNPIIMMSLEDPAIRLFESSFNNTSVLFSNFLSETKTSGLPQYVNSSTSLPVCIGSDNPFPSAKDFGFEELLKEEASEPVSYRQSFFKIPMVPGSSESIKFLTCINECEENDVFSTDFIRSVLVYKWGQVRYLILSQMAVYVLYLTMLCIYSCVLYEYNSALVSVFVLSGVLFLYELLQMITGGLGSYLYSWWNYIDLSRFILQLVYCILVWTNYNYATYYLLSTVIFLAFVRGGAYFRIFDYTRYYINLLLVVCWTIIPFMLIFLYTTFAFMIIFQIVQNSQEVSFMIFVKQSYELNIGGFNTESFDEYQYFFFFLQSMFNPIIILNLLISIMSDTYATVSENEVSASMIELADLVLEAELLMFWNRAKNDKKYFCICDSSKPKDNGNDKTLAKVNKINLTLKNLAKYIKEKDDEFAEDVKSIHQKLDLLLDAQDLENRNLLTKS